MKSCQNNQKKIDKSLGRHFSHFPLLIILAEIGKIITG